jgi:MoaA/NifB/PqqE/SkfB family radical SAM enzyme
VHFIGERDPFIPVVQARRFPFQTMVIPSAGHELNRAPGLAPAVIEHIVASSYGRKHLDPGTRARHTTASSMASLGLTVAAPAPARLDVEITTRCPLECPLCARTLFRQIPHHPDMEPSVFEKLLTQMEHLKEIFFVGLGEPLLHPRLDAFIERATARSIPSRLVTNGLLASPGVLARLRDKGLSEVTFSIDSVDPARFRALKGGARLDVVLEHFRSVPADMAKSVFVTLSQDNVDDLAGLVDLVAEAGLRALAVSDANFAPNASRSLHASPSTRQLADAIRHAREKNILLVSPHFHDLDRTFDSYRQCRVRKPADLSSRYDRHTHCLAPWRIAVISANGDMTPCNCSPMTVVGNVARGSCGDIWNGERMQEWRWNVMSGSCRDCCDCPRY